MKHALFQRSADIPTDPAEIERREQEKARIKHEMREWKEGRGGPTPESITVPNPGGGFPRSRGGWSNE